MRLLRWRERVSSGLVKFWNALVKGEERVWKVYMPIPRVDVVAVRARRVRGEVDSDVRRVRRREEGAVAARRGRRGNSIVVEMAWIACRWGERYGF